MWNYDDDAFWNYILLPKKGLWHWIDEYEYL